MRLMLLVSPLVEIILAQAQHRPSIVLLQADDLGYGDIGLYNSERVGDTPNIDAIGKDGVYLKNYRILSPPVCSPSRAALLVGMEGQVAGFPNIADCIFHNAQQKQESVFYDAVLDNKAVQRRTMSDCVLRLNETWPSLSHVLSYAGYYTALLGKWHLGCDKGLPPAKAYGWDFVKAYNTDRTSWNFWPNEMKWYWEDKQLLSDAIVTEADKIMSEKTQELFLYINPLLPHAPLSPRREHMAAVGPTKCNLNVFFKNGFKWSKLSTTQFIKSKSKVAQYRRSDACIERIYRGSIYSFDVLVGQIQEALRKHALFENTLFLITSDNGPETRTRGRHQPSGRFSQVGSTAGLRGHKRSLYDGGCKVPLIISWPAMRSTLKRRAFVMGDVEVLNVDILPTFAALAGVSSYLEERPDSRRVGRPIALLVEESAGESSSTHSSPLLTKGSTRNIVFWEWAYPQLETCEGMAPRFSAMSRDSGIKFLGDYNAAVMAQLQEGRYARLDIESREIFRRSEVYNLSSDPYERHDLLKRSDASGMNEEQDALWAHLVAPLARALAHWIFDTLPKTRGLMTSLHDPCRAGSSAHGLTITQNFTHTTTARDARRKRQRSQGVKRRQQRQSHSKQDIARIKIADNAPADPLFTGEEKPPLSWSMIKRSEVPPSYRHIRISAGSGIWCGYDACFVASSVSPSDGAELSMPKSNTWRNTLNRGNPRGFILVANNPSLNSIPMRCPPPGYRIVRFNHCESRWPPPTSEDIIILRSTKIPSGYWGLTFPSKDISCSATFGGVHFSIMLLGGDGGILKDQDPVILTEIWRLPKEEADNMREITFSSGSTMAFLLRHAFPNIPIIAVGFNFHREYPCKMHSFSDCLRHGHNYTLERLMLAAVPRLHILQTSSEIDKYSSEWLPPSSDGRCSSSVSSSL